MNVVNMLASADLVTWLGFAVSVILPAFVALVTKQTAHSGVKAITLLVLAAVTGFVDTWIDAANQGAVFNFGAAAVATLMSFAVAVLAHFGLLSPAAITGSQGKIQTKVPGGIG